jgi:uncharacterized GH25 family protein
MNDLTTTADSIVFPAYSPKTKGTLLVTVLVNGLPQPKYVTVEVYQTENGSEGTTVLTKETSTDGYGTFDFEVTQGIHVVKIYHKKGSAEETSRIINVAIPAGEQLNAIINLTTNFSVEL